VDHPHRVAARGQGRCGAHHREHAQNVSFIAISEHQRGGIAAVLVEE
jgi:hypothetical protein